MYRSLDGRKRQRHSSTWLHSFPFPHSLKVNSPCVWVHVKSVRSLTYNVPVFRHQKSTPTITAQHSKTQLGKLIQHEQLCTDFTDEVCKIFRTFIQFKLSTDNAFPPF